MFLLTHQHSSKFNIKEIPISVQVMSERIKPTSNGAMVQWTNDPILNYSDRHNYNKIQIFNIHAIRTCNFDQHLKLIAIILQLHQ